jgi:hypothetical protein
MDHSISKGILLVLFPISHDLEFCVADYDAQPIDSLREFSDHPLTRTCLRPLRFTDRLSPSMAFFLTLLMAFWWRKENARRDTMSRLMGVAAWMREQRGQDRELADGVPGSDTRSKTGRKHPGPMQPLRL